MTDRAVHQDALLFGALHVQLQHERRALAAQLPISKISAGFYETTDGQFQFIDALRYGWNERGGWIIRERYDDCGEPNYEPHWTMYNTLTDARIALLRDEREAA